ncbi:uncharacterized protein LOC114251347 [Bombyx mandarina]|uniref:Uncharacterized protein LOC114251347 n=1 Tax=Bombyx mandarina TaxID=7092 RepID=A0A6J2KGB2_BOMMA|nr:uncharacterized protein LOC114251347 [Bombyx mandarina]
MSAPNTCRSLSPTYRAHPLAISLANSLVCSLDHDCDLETRDQVECGFDARNVSFKMFPSHCSMRAYSRCLKMNYVSAPLKFCIKNQRTRRSYGESCPVFCPNHYSPVCGASKMRDYAYRTFNNGCQLDMLNCRGDSDLSGYVEVPLEYCQNHHMKNIFKEQAVFTNMNEYADYD